MMRNIVYIFFVYNGQATFEKMHHSRAVRLHVIDPRAVRVMRACSPYGFLEEPERLPILGGGQVCSVYGVDAATASANRCADKGIHDLFAERGAEY